MAVHRLAAERLSRALGEAAPDMEPVARFLHTFHAQLVAQGFTRDEALHLVARLEDSLLAHLLERPE